MAALSTEPTIPAEVLVRPLRSDDDVADLTHLIHEAYAVHRERGLKFWATHQSVEDTANRFASGHGFVAEVDGVVAGTVTVRGPQPQSPVELYRDAATWTVIQFAAAPVHKGLGLGHALHEAALAYVASHGGTPSPSPSTRQPLLPI